MKPSAWHAYRATARSHRRLLCIPIVLAVGIAAWSVLGAPKSYVSTASLFVDNSAATGSSLGDVNPTETAPAQQEQTVLQELISTKRFVLAVARSSSLASYLAANPHPGFGPSAILSRFTGSESIPLELEADLDNDVTETVPGPQVLQISFTGPTPQVAQNTLTAVINVLESATGQFARDYGESQVSYYQQQVSAAMQALSAARSQASANNPASSGKGPGTTSAAVSSASQQLSAANVNLRQAQSAELTGSTGAVTRLIDAPSLPINATSGKKTEVLGIVGGLLAGVVVSLLAVVLLTPGGINQLKPRQLPEIDFEIPELAATAGLGALPHVSNTRPHARRPPDR